MTFTKFEELLKSKYPTATACAHGTFAGTETTNRVSITFKPNGKVYDYSGSYASILGRLGFAMMYQRVIDEEKRRLEYMKSNNGKSDEFFGDICDYTEDIEVTETWLADVAERIDRGEYILVD